MKHKNLIISLCPILILNTIFPTVIITHGLGTQGIDYYQNSKYVDLITESAQNLGHETICIPWLDHNHKAKGFAGILPQERIESAIKIAKKILDEVKTKKSIILIGHGYGGQVMACATRLLNPENTELTDSFIFELIHTIKNFGSNEQTKSISPQTFIDSVVLGWRISKTVFDLIESSNLANPDLIKLIKQNLSLKFTEETKKSWKSAFHEVQSYRKKILKDETANNNLIQTLYTIGTVNNGDMAFTPDMKIVQNHINFYSSSDSILLLAGKKQVSQHTRATNVEVLFEATKGTAPKHDEFCGNILMAPWILLVPQELKSKNLGGFECFEWGKNGTVTFYPDRVPWFKN